MTKISWPEIRAHAHQFVQDWRTETKERPEAQTFWNEFFQIFGLKRRHVAAFEKKVKRLSNISGRGQIDCFWPGRILIEHKSAGEDLNEALDQALEYFDGLKPMEWPEVILACDFQRFAYRNLQTGEDRRFSLRDLPDNLDLFGFFAGYERQIVRDELPVNRQAAEIMGSIHDTLEKAGNGGHALEILLMRLMFCLFAEDTGIFEPAGFYVFLDERTQEDGSDLGLWLGALFTTLNTDHPARMAKLDEALKDFPYVNGGLFSETLPTVWFSRKLRQQLLDASLDFNWGQISPAVFGSLFQSIMDRKKRRDLGAHYTSERSILRLIKSLFLDELEEELTEILERKGPRRLKRLQAFHDKLAGLRFLDPACGCGNFLVIAYRELRLLELAVIKEMLAIQSQDKQLVTDISLLVRVNVDQFGGIEIEEWPARIAETALWLTDHQMNRKLQELGTVFDRLPLRTSPKIVHANSLRLDWSSVIPKPDLTYILGNPPFRGKQHQSAAQKSDMQAVFGGKVPGVLDYVTAWYRKAAEYIQGSEIQCAYVSTNSVAQGEQVAPLWKALAPFDLHINFAHQYFDWDTEGAGRAAVYVVIIGFASFSTPRKHVVSYDDLRGDGQQTECITINPYLVADGEEILVESRRTALSAPSEIHYGSMANEARPKGDTRPLFFLETKAEYEDFLKREPQAKKWTKPFIGADELISGTERWCLWLDRAGPSDIKAMPEVRRRIKEVEKNRAKSSREATRALADTPHLFGEIRQPKRAYLAIPLHSSEQRKIIPFRHFDKNTIVGNACAFIQGEDPYVFGILQSSMHMAWVSAVGGRLEGRYRYSNGLVYNTFPWPDNVPPKRRSAVVRAAKAVLKARDHLADETLDALYTPGLMPRPLVLAHRALDAAVDACYGRRFKTMNDRLVELFKLYKRQRDHGQGSLLPDG